MRLIVVVLVFAFAAAASPGHADDEDTTGWLKLKRGTRVRLIVEYGGPMRRLAGRLLRSDASTVTIVTATGPQTMAREKLFHLSYRVGHRKKGAAIVAAGIVGLVACAVALDKELDRTLSENRGNGQSEGLICGLPGLGAIAFGINAGRDDWRDVKPDGLTVTGAAAPLRATVALQPVRGGAGLALALSF